MNARLAVILGVFVLLGLLGGMGSALAADPESAVITPLRLDTAAGGATNSQDPYFGLNDFLAEMQRVIPDCTTGNVVCEEAPMGTTCKFQTNCRCSGNPPSACKLPGH